MLFGVFNFHQALMTVFFDNGGTLTQDQFKAALTDVR